jgi:hypothetical protein
MTYQIIDWEEDVAGKWRIRVGIDGQTVMFKFDERPNDEVVQAEAARYAAMMREQANAAANSK